MKPGFSIIELVMVMAISTIISTTLFQIYNQITHNMLRVERFIYEDTQLLTVKNRLEKDVSGLSSIWFTQEQLEKNKKSEKDKQKKESTGLQENKKSNYFYSINKDENLDTLMFLTTNGLRSFGSVENRFVRVVYHLEKDSENKNLFMLMRKEIGTPTENIDEEVLKKGKFYKLLSGLKSIEMTYYLIDKKALKQKAKSLQNAQSSADDKSEPTEEQKPFIRSVKQWEISDIKKDEKQLKNDEKDEDDENDLGDASVPKFIEMKIVFGQTHQQLEREYVLDFYVPSTVDNIPKLMPEPQAIKPDNDEDVS